MGAAHRERSKLTRGLRVYSGQVGVTDTIVGRGIKAKMGSVLEHVADGQSPGSEGIIHYSLPLWENQCERLLV